MTGQVTLARSVWRRKQGCTRTLRPPRNNIRRAARAGSPRPRIRGEELNAATNTRLLGLAKLAVSIAVPVIIFLLTQEFWATTMLLLVVGASGFIELVSGMPTLEFLTRWRRIAPWKRALIVV